MRRSSSCAANGTKPSSSRLPASRSSTLLVCPPSLLGPPSSSHIHSGNGWQTSIHIFPPSAAGRPKAPAPALKFHSAQRNSFAHSSSSLLEFLRMVCCCLCCPVYRCALWLCLFEVLVSVLIWWNLLDFIVKTFEVLQLKDVLIFLLLSGWLVTLFTSTGTLILAERKKNAEYVLPRVVQQAGLLVMGFLCAILLIVYFSGGASSINNALISIFEYVVLEKPLSRDERRDAYDSLKYSFMLLIILDFFFICYIAFGLAITRKYQKELERNFPSNGGGGRSHQGGHFKPLNQNAPSAPPPHNPSFIPA